MTTNQQNNESNLYLVSALALVFIVVTALFSWVTLPPAKRGIAEVAPAEHAPAQEAVSAPAQVSAGNPSKGQELFTATCAACHGPAGQGVQGLGKDVTTSAFIAGETDQELVDFIKVGRDPSDPLNTTGIGMPAKGGNPSLSDEDLLDIVAFIRSIQQ